MLALTSQEIVKELISFLVQVAYYMINLNVGREMLVTCKVVFMVIFQIYTCFQEDFEQIYGHRTLAFHRHYTYIQVFIINYVHYVYMNSWLAYVESMWLRSTL